MVPVTGIDEERSDEEPPHLYGGNPSEDSSTVFAMQKHRTKRKSISGKQLFSKLILAFCKAMLTEKSGTRDGDRTRTPCGKQILSLLRLPFRHPGTEKRVHLLKDSCTL